MSNTHIKPTNNHVLILADPPEEAFVNGILKPFAYIRFDKIIFGEVVESKFKDVDNGDRAMFQKNRGTKFSIDGKDYFLVSGKDILAVI
jgi:co-chaperonin GroES (HSP10)